MALAAAVQEMLEHRDASQSMREEGRRYVEQERNWRASVERYKFVVPMIIMAPIPLTLLGIVPGHLLLGAEFTATSMIGFIALAGIIVRNSILLVQFSRQERQCGVPLHEALLGTCRVRTRPILITALALVGGSAVILTDPIFQGMAVSLLFGVLVSTVLTLIVVPLGCFVIKRP